MAPPQIPWPLHNQVGCSSSSLLRIRHPCALLALLRWDTRRRNEDLGSTLDTTYLPEGGLADCQAWIFVFRQNQPSRGGLADCFIRNMHHWLQLWLIFVKPSTQPIFQMEDWLIVQGILNNVWILLPSTQPIFHKEDWLIVKGIFILQWIFLLSTQPILQMEDWLIVKSIFITY